MAAHAQLPKASDALAAMEARLRLAVVGLSIAAVAAAWLVWRAAAELPYLGLAASPAAGSPDVRAIRLVELAMKPPTREVRVDLEIRAPEAPPIASAREPGAEGGETVLRPFARNSGAGEWPIEGAAARGAARAEPGALESATEVGGRATIGLLAAAAPRGPGDSAWFPTPMVEVLLDPEQAPAGARRAEAEAAMTAPSAITADVADRPAQAAEPAGDAPAEPQAGAGASGGAVEMESAAPAPIEAVPSSVDLVDPVQPAAPGAAPAEEAADEASATSEIGTGASEGSAPSDPAGSMQPATLDAEGAQGAGDDAAAGPEIEAGASQGVSEEESAEAMAVPADPAQPAALDGSAQAPDEAPAVSQIEAGASQGESDAEDATPTDLVEPARIIAPDAESARESVEESAELQGEAGASVESAETESAAAAPPAGASAGFVPLGARTAEPEADPAAQARVATGRGAEEGDRTMTTETNSPAAPAAGTGSSQSDLRSQETAPPADEGASVPTAPSLTEAQIESYVRRGDEHLKNGDIAAARLLYERAAAAGDAAAMLALARTFDGQALKAWGVVGLAPEEERARYWYRKAAAARQAAAE